MQVFIPTTERRKHPVYKHSVYWATVQDVDGQPVEQCGPYRDKAEAIAKARAMAAARQSRSA